MIETKKLTDSTLKRITKSNNTYEDVHITDVPSNVLSEGTSITDQVLENINISAFNGALTFGTGALARYLGYGFTSDFLLNKGFDSILYKSKNYLKGYVLEKTITLPFKIIYYFLEHMLND